jgi:rSAM/selenodomain-associated transferase 2
VTAATGQADGGSTPLSIVVPVRNDAAALARLLAELGGLGVRGEVIVVDGGSTDDSVAVARRSGARVLEAGGGRGGQLAAGCRAATGRWLWLLHADSSDLASPLTWLTGLAARRVEGWGRFDVLFDPSTAAMTMVAWFMNRRSRLTGICTGDQGIFVARATLEAAGGIPEQPLMEDIELSRRLKRLGCPMCRPETIATSPRRWLGHGVLRTVLRMWWFRLRYWAGASPASLARAYYR